MHLTLLALTYGSPEFVLIIIAMGMLIPLVVGTTAVVMKSRERQMWHETARLALEKGQPMPPLSGRSEEYRRFRERREKNDVRAGLIMIGIGAGIFLFLAAAGNGEARFIGTIPGFIGVALLLSGVINAVLAKDKKSPEDRPPQS
jgi:hypothetical protein